MLWTPQKSKPGLMSPVDFSAVPGCQFLSILNEGVGAPNDCAGGIQAVTTGAPVWSSGPMGAQRGSYGTTAYDDFTTSSQVMLSIYPCWMLALFVNTSTSTDMTMLCNGNPGNASPFAILEINRGSTANLCAYFPRDNTTGGPIVSATIAAASNGLPHVMMGVSYTASDHRLYFDGVQQANSATAVGATTLPTITLGVLHRTTVTLPMSAAGAGLITAAAGNGQVPDPLTLANALLSGQFPVLRPFGWLATPAAAASSLVRRTSMIRAGSRGAA